jgi:drug/metabolite transporter (DMT)-like permease
MAWLYYALASSIFWGISYAIAERILKTVNISTSVMFGYFVGFIITAIYNIFYGNVKNDINNITPKIFFMMLFCAVINSSAVFLINNAIQQKNATYAGLIEICYPFFTIIASYVIFRELQINFNSGIGAILIFIGILFMSRG